MVDVELSIVVPTLRDRSEVEVIPALERCGFDEYEVILRDDTPVTRARNEGYKRAAADKIVYLDDDSRPRDGYLGRAATLLDEEPAIAGRTVHPRDDLFAGQLTTHYSFGDESGYVDRFWGCNMGLRREVLEGVGGWDEGMGWGHEEKELAERVCEAHRIYYDPELVVDHVYAESLWDYWQKHYRLEKNSPYYFRKRGVPTVRILAGTFRDFLTPQNYLGRTPELTLARSGRNLAKTSGRLVGLARAR